ncbi:MAG: hypothetical protein JNL72_05270 [Flavipsychrobacter sp.]|nr:hypothetical protein [Flavipsychrobacter sp.]
MFTIKTPTEQNVNYQFFKALYCNGQHYLCDFSNTVTADSQLKYLVDIEIPGEGQMHLEMVQSTDGWQFTEAKNGTDNRLESELSAMIYHHILLH